MSITTLPQDLIFRPATIKDADAVTNLLNTCAQSLTGKPDYEVERILSEWRFPNFTLETDTRLAVTPKGQTIGYAGLWDNEPHVRLYGWLNVHPDYQARDLGLRLLQWVEQRAKQAISQAPQGTRVTLLLESLSTDRFRQKLLQQHNYQVVRHGFRMLIDMHEPPPKPAFPPGISVRAFVREQDLHKLILADREAFQDHWGYVEHPLKGEIAAWNHWIDSDPQYDPELWFIALDGDEIAGFSLCQAHMASDPRMGWVENLAVRRPWRRRGLGLALLQHSFGELYRRDKPCVGLDVDAKNLTGATRLYEKAGMRVDRRYVHYEKELRPGQELSTQSVD